MSDVSLPTPEPREPPHSTEAEVAVLGGILLDPTAIDTVADVLRPEDFFSERHAVLYGCMLDLHARQFPIEVLTLWEALKASGHEGEVDLIYLSRLLDAVPTLANLRQHAEIVRKHSLLRSVIQVCNAIADEAYRGVPDVQTFLDAAESRLFALTQERTSRGPEVIRGILKSVFTNLQARITSKEPLTGVSTGFFALDDVTLGFHPGELIILAARPGMGKTALALNLLLNAVSKSRKAGVVFSLEMPAETLASRLLCARARVRSHDFRKGHILADRQEDLSRLTEAASFLSDLRLFIDDTAMLSLMDLRARCRRLKAQEKDLALVVVDYLQLMQGDRRIESREQQISAISRGLKILAKELAVPVLALSQLNREVERRSDKRPTLADLRESGAIEQDADLVAFLYRDEEYRKDSPDKGKAELIIAKHRNGRTDKIELKFFREYGLFENLASGHEFQY